MGLAYSFSGFFSIFLWIRNQIISPSEVMEPQTWGGMGRMRLQFWLENSD